MRPIGAQAAPIAVPIMMTAMPASTNGSAAVMFRNMLVETDCLERPAALQQRLDNVVRRRLLSGVRVRARKDDEAVFVREAKFVVRHPAEQAVHHGRRADAEAERERSDCDHRRAACPEAEGETDVGQMGHDLLPRRDVGRRVGKELWQVYSRPEEQIAMPSGRAS